jgi:hypothetical protein
VTPMLLFLARTLASPCLGREPKVRVVTIYSHELFLVVIHSDPLLFASKFCSNGHVVEKSHDKIIKIFHFMITISKMFLTF